MPAVTTRPAASGLNNSKSQYDLSVIVVSYNTREILHRCFEHLKEASYGLTVETIVIDNASRDGSVQMLETQYPDIRVIPSNVNLGFGGANNRGLLQATGRYVILLNSDAFLQPEALRRSIDYMDSNPEIGLGGARLIGPNGAWQPSARSFPSILNDFLSLSGLAHKFSDNHFFGRADRTWADPMVPAEVDWVPGAYAIVRPKALEEAGIFDEDFFLYYEEVDLCRRIKTLGYKIHYWPDVVVVHLGGESSKTIAQAVMSRSGSQLTLWRIRSEFLYYRKHHGSTAFVAYLMEWLWHGARRLRNQLAAGPQRLEKAEESYTLCHLLSRAWKETRGGRVSPPRPW